MTPELSVILPCYNEAGNLPELIKILDELISGKSIEIILVNNGSVDRSDEVFKQELASVKNPGQFKLVTLEKNQGYGNGILTGLSHGTGRLLGFSHADLQCDPKNIIEAYSLYLKTEATQSLSGQKFMIKGQRFDRREEEKPFSYNLDKIASIILRVPMRDINGQPKIFPRELFTTHLTHAPKDLTFDVFLMAKTLKLGWKVFTVPVFFGVRTSGVSSWNTTPWSRIKMVLRFLRTIFKVRLLLFKKPDQTVAGSA
jgi:dolichol-phosphate mannosyltransferase